MPDAPCPPPGPAHPAGTPAGRITSNPPAAPPAGRSPAGYDPVTAWLTARPSSGPRRLWFCTSCGAPAGPAGTHLFGPAGHAAASAAEFPVVLVNLASWDDPRGYSRAHLISGAVLIANAPRPLYGIATWKGPFRHGIFYAAAHGAEAPWDSWRADDAWIIRFVTNEQITAAVTAKLAGHGYGSIAAFEAESGVTCEDIARTTLELPWSTP